MKLLFFSTDLNLLDEWKKRHAIENFVACQSLESLEYGDDFILIADYDSVAVEINKMISSNTLPSKTVVLEREPEILTGKMLIRHGIKAYANARISNIHFKQMLETLTQNDVWTYPELTAALAKSQQKAPLSEDSLALLQKRLTLQEIEVVKLILEGLTNDAIGAALGITTRTVKAHITSLFQKLHVNDRLSLVLLLK